MNKIALSISLFALIMASCQFLNTDIDLNNIKDPENDIFRIYSDFELDRFAKEYTDSDDHMDILIAGYRNEDAYWDEYYFINNGDDTYTFYTYDEYWSYNDDYYYDDYDYYDDYGTVEEYFDYDEYNDVLDITYGDLDDDGYDDAVAIVFFDGDDYQSYDAHIFINNGDDTYYNWGLSEVHYPSTSYEYDEYKQTVIKDGYFTIELEGDSPKWERYITFTYDYDYGEFYLFKDGGVVYDDYGNIVREEVLDEDDFGTVYFYEFYGDENDYFSLKQDVSVSNMKEFLEALGSNKRIFMEPGKYVINDRDALPEAAKRAFDDASGWEEFYTDDYYYLYGGSAYDDIQLYLTDLRNLEIIGVGDVEMVVTDEYLTVLTFEYCNSISMENVYLVHEVGGVCAADVVDILYCDDMDFTDVIFDGSGVIGVYADGSYALEFTDCEFTNCSDGAVDFYDSYGDFYECTFSDNTIWNALIYASEYSSLYFYDCLIEDNEKYDSNYNDDGYLFASYNSAYIYVDYMTTIRNNQVDRTLNDRDYITIETEI